MNTIPRELRTKLITSYIHDLICDGLKDSFELSDDNKENLTALAINAYGGDIDIVLSSDANTLLAKYILSNDPDDAIEFRNAAKASAWEHFADYFDALIQEQVDLVEIDSLEEAGKHPYMDKNTGETLWV